MAGKRGNGEGNIRQRANGTWEARTLLGGESRSVYGKTRQEVARKLAALIRDHDKGLPIVPERQTVGAFLAGWIEDARPQLRPSSYRRYGDHVRVHLIPGLGKLTLSKLSAQHVQAFYTRKLAEGLSSTTVHHIHGTLHRALEDAERMGLVQRNVSEQVRAPRRSTAEMQTLTEEQANRFLEAAEGDRFHAVYVLALTTGMREGELLGLRWRDLDLDGDAPSLQVRMAVQEADKGYVVAEPKTAYSRRRIALTSMAVDALRAHHVWQAEERLALGAAWDASLDLVFPNAIGGIMIPHNLAKRGFKRLLQRAGLSDELHFHCLRHTAATMLLSRGVHPKVVSEMLGHADISITLRVYAHVTPTMQQAAVDVMERVFGRRGA
jgi:integrase